MCQLDRVGVGGGGDAGLAAGGLLSHHTQLFQDIGCTFDMCLLTLPMMLPLLSLHPAARLSPRLTGVMVCETGREREREYAVSVSVCVTGINSGSETWQRVDVLVCLLFLKLPVCMLACGSFFHEHS